MRRVLNILLCLGLVLSLSANERAHAQEDTPNTALPSWEYTPYQVRLSLGSSDQSVPAAELETIQVALQPLVEREWRGSWKTLWTLGAAPPEAAAASVSPDAQAEGAPANATDADKIAEIDLLRLGTETRIQVSYRDIASRRVSEPLRQLAETPAEIPAQTAALLRQGFAPLTRVSKYDNGQATLRIKGGKLLGVSGQLTAGSVLLPLERARSESTDAAQTRSLKWTLLGVTRVNGAQLGASVHSGLAQAGDPGESRPIDFLALPLLSVRPETTLTIVGLSPAVAAINNDLPAEEQAKAVATISQAKVPLPGVRVTARFFDQPARIAWSGVTDQQGRLRLPARWDSKLGGYRAQLWLLDIGAGGETLATLPCCPGAMDSLTLSLPANPQWITTQQWLDETRELVLQIRARKMVLLARIAEANKNKQAAEVGRLQSELKLLPDAGKVLQTTPVVTLVPEGADGTAALALLQKRQLAALTEIRGFAAGLGGNLPADPNLPVEPMPMEAAPEAVNQ